MVIRSRDVIGALIIGVKGLLPGREGVEIAIQG